MLFESTRQTGATVRHWITSYEVDTASLARDHRDEHRTIAPRPPVTWATSVRSASRENARGGDVFEALTRKDGAISILMADLSSKGALAELHSEALRSVFARCVYDERQPASILAVLNRLKLESPLPESDVAFASAFVATFDAGLGSMVYASAGHDLGIIIGERSHRHLATTGPLIGVLADPLFAERYEPLGVDELFVLVTDGVTECRCARAEGIQFGTRGIVRALASTRTHDPLAAHDAIVRSLQEFGGGYYRDDATIAVLAAR
jgi:sigma-B regulation protein RsbU (phosphoserine phosphatase)